jgi:prepilin-type N-terminal cleavage/methylation domain-containing protein
MNRFWILDIGFWIVRAEAGRRSRFVPTIHNPKSKIQDLPRSGFTLLEVILALVILGASLAMLGEVLRLANRNAEESRLEARAQILAASIMDQGTGSSGQ